MKPCDCHDIDTTMKELNEQGLKLNDYSIEVRPSVVILDIGLMCQVKIPQRTFHRLAEWYFEDQEKEK